MQIRTFSLGKYDVFLLKKDKIKIMECQDFIQRHVKHKSKNQPKQAGIALGSQPKLSLVKITKLKFYG